MRAALIKNDEVLNVIEYDPESSFDPGEGVQIVVIEDLPNNVPVGPGWLREQGVFKQSAPASLTADPSSIPADGITFSKVTYVLDRSRRSGMVVFNVDGRRSNIPVEDGQASLNVSSSEAKTIVVTCESLSVEVVATAI